MKHILITTCLILLSLNKTIACLNGDSKILKNGTILYEDNDGSVPHGHHFFEDELESGIKELDSLYKASNDLDYLSDKGLLLILLKRYKEAILLYLEIENMEANRYSTASNIGTAYELMGQNENALKWIKKSVELDPKSHYSSEWIHVKILEAKIKGEEVYTTKFLLNTEFGSGIAPSSQMSKQQLQDLSKALYYQLNERMSFVKPPEKIVAQLLFDLGNIAFLLNDNYDALSDYQQAKLYGYTGKLLEQRQALAEIYLEKVKQQATKIKVEPQKQRAYVRYGLWLLGGILAALLAVLVYKRKKNKS